MAGILRRVLRQERLAGGRREQAHVVGCGPPHPRRRHPRGSPLRNLGFWSRRGAGRAPHLRSARSPASLIADRAERRPRALRQAEIRIVGIVISSLFVVEVVSKLYAFGLAWLLDWCAPRFALSRHANAEPRPGRRRAGTILSTLLL